jgi:hypothetical protein
MARLGLIVRLLMLAACLVPFTSTRQAGALLALAPSVPVQDSPAPQEDDSEREEESSGKEKQKASRMRLEHRAGSGQHHDRVPPTAAPSLPKKPTHILHPLDPFRNGLGSPYRC